MAKSVNIIVGIVHSMGQDTDRLWEINLQQEKNINKEIQETQTHGTGKILRNWPTMSISKSKHSSQWHNKRIQPVVRRLRVRIPTVP